MLTHGPGTLRAPGLLKYAFCRPWRYGETGGEKWLYHGWEVTRLMGLPPKAGRGREQFPLLPWVWQIWVLTPGVAGTGCLQEQGMLSRGAAGPERTGTALGGGLSLQAPGKDLLLLFEARLNAGSMICSNNINKYNSSHRENLVFTVNSTSKQRHHFVFYSLTPFIILYFNRCPLGP